MARIAVVPGDGIGKEVVPQGVRVLEHLARRENIPIELEAFDLGADRYLADGTTLPDDLLPDRDLLPTSDFPAGAFFRRWV